MWKILLKFVLRSLIKSLAKEVDKSEKKACKCDQIASDLRVNVQNQIHAHKKEAVSLRHKAETAKKQKDAIKALGF